jgi:hypothetical protein
LSAVFLPVSRLVVNAFTGLFAFTFRASFNTRWLRRLPVRRCVVRFLGLPNFSLSGKWRLANTTDKLIKSLDVI